MAHLPDLAAFIVVAKEKSFTEAAKQLQVTPSALSKLVKRLERALQAQLFVRSTRKLAITPIGEEVVLQAQQMLNAAQQAFVVAEQYQNRVEGTLTIAAPEAYLHSVLQPIVVEFLAEHPLVNIKILAIDGDYDLNQKGVDIAFKLTDTPSPELVGKNFGGTKLVLVASSDYLASKGTPKTPSELAEHDCLFIAEREDTASWTFRKDNQSEKVVVHGRFAANQSQLRLNAVLGGLGIGIFHDFVINAHLESGTVNQVLPEWSLESRYFGSVYAQYHGSTYIPIKVGRFIEYCEQKLG
ncbi:LysR family transcriptional regulator [Vibrio sp. qd031]|nr:LysR family transcriptional regulator [Vibrio sp. qd031]